MLVPAHIQDLLVPPAQHPRGQGHISSASGLARIGRWLCVIADDEHHLGVFSADDRASPGRLVRLLAGDLPPDAAARKAIKPDFEALLALTSDGVAGASLLALGSGSRPNREFGLLFQIGSEGGLLAQPRQFDLGALYGPLRDSFKDLNIEGGFVANDRLHLLQRGNKGGSGNACIAFPLGELMQWLDEPSLRPPPFEIRRFELGASRDVPYGFTDAAALAEGGWLFSAVAEDTADSYADGACTGSVIGWVDAAGQLIRMESIEGSPKVEGICIAADGRLLAVTDADDPARASRLLVLQRLLP